MIEGMIRKQDALDVLLDLRNAFDHAFDGYIGDVVVSDFRMTIDEKLKELSQ